MTTPDDMVERVARAMFEAGWPSEESRIMALKNNAVIMDGCRKLARAAIQAMLEPTETMVVAGAISIAAVDAEGHNEAPLYDDFAPEGRAVLRELARASFRDAISAALGVS